MCSLEKRGRVFVLTLTGDGEHRLSPALLDSMLEALHQLRAELKPGSALITTSQGKFFSNGFDLDWARSASAPDTFQSRFGFMARKLLRILAALSTLPCPTIAAVSGHAAAAGFLLALAHDYIFMRSDRGFIYMSEVDLGITISATGMALIRCKIPAPEVRRDLVLLGKKFTAAAAVEAGLIDKALGNSGETLKEALRFGEELAEKNWDGKVYADMRLSTFPDLGTVVGGVEKSRL